MTSQSTAAQRLSDQEDQIKILLKRVDDLADLVNTLAGIVSDYTDAKPVIADIMNRIAVLETNDRLDRRRYEAHLTHYHQVSASEGRGRIGSGQ